MKTPRSISTSSRLGFSVLLMLTALAVTPHHAAANTAANTKIINTATVSYKDAGGFSQTATASATVTVSLVAATPTLNPLPTDQYTTLSVAASYIYTIFSNANGPDTYNLTIPVKTNSANITTSTAVPPASVSLGATTIFTPVTIPAATATAITVPSDGVSDGSVNGISTAVGNNKVVINGLVYTVSAITDSPIGTSTITVTGPASIALTYGTVIGEQKTFTLAVTPTVMIATTTDETITTTISARDSGNLAVAATDITVTTVQGANLTVTKMVSTDGTTWALTVAAPPVTLGLPTPLYYRITVHNGGAANATAVVITDPLTPYTTYTGGTAKRATGAAVSYSVAPLPFLTDLSAADDGYDFGVTTLGVVTYSVATILPGVANDVQLFFMVTIK